ncbi:hypothetical protein GUJ93_ZPchr0001g32274 [Zizania palustris]|uniref:Uncharacterized protein n=1 Tax=Zizania palustris TaxID=103762 RepID=A0A8J5S9E3_ZIZPA|nr:hypothetical protein GUJ93_ZPchr0001g32274 [Zizania palustris]
MSLTGRGGGGADGRSEAAAEEEEEGPAMEWLDEYWFFSNTLVKNGRQSVGRPPMLPRSPLTPGGRPTKQYEPAGMSRFYALSRERRLLRTPSPVAPVASRRDGAVH